MEKRRFRNISGPSIQKARNRLGLSQDELAAKLQIQGLTHLDRVQIAKIEGGMRSLFDWELVIFAKVLNVEMGSLIPLKGLKSEIQFLQKGFK